MKYDVSKVRAVEAELLAFFSPSRRYVDLSLPMLQVQSAVDACAVIRPMLFPSSPHPEIPLNGAKPMQQAEKKAPRSILENTGVYHTTMDLQNALRYHPACRDMLRYRVLNSRYTNSIDKHFKETGSREHGFSTIQREVEAVWENARAAYDSLLKLQKAPSAGNPIKEDDLSALVSSSSSSLRMPCAAALPDRVVFVILHSGSQHALPVGEPMREFCERLRFLVDEGPWGAKILRVVPVRIGLQDFELKGPPNPHDGHTPAETTEETNYPETCVGWDRAGEEEEGACGIFSSSLHFPHGGLFTLHGVLQRLRALPSLCIPSSSPSSSISTGENGVLKRRVLVLSDAWLQPRLTAAMHGAAIDPERDWLERKGLTDGVRVARKKTGKAHRKSPRERRRRFGRGEHVVNVFPAVMSEGLTAKEIDAFARYALVHYILS
ncbi:unnamed protein product [Phytomonas sp. EM1]|nr:unnamed protein product [Phytomonas sp. EM1]|eukprot:CCW64145.1 unnamed protein product [Phytomonas sp. isolate EM1]